MSKLNYLILPFLFFCCLNGDPIFLKTKNIQIKAPEDAIALDSEAIQMRFYKGNAPHVVFDIVGSGATLTIRESVTLGREIVASEFATVMLNALKMNSKEFELVESKTKIRGQLTYHEIVFTDLSENNLTMKRRVRLYTDGHTLFVLGSGIPSAYVGRYEERILESMKTFQFIK